MKVIFLDIDGVLNNMICIREYIAKGIEPNELTDEQSLMRHFDLNCYDRLAKIVKITGAKIVLSSSWRSDFKDGVNKVQMIPSKLLVKYFKERNIEIIDITELEHKDRGLQILNYLNTHKNINKYVVIDDEKFDIEKYIGKDHFVKTEFEFGLQDEHVKEAIDKLNK